MRVGLSFRRHPRDPRLPAPAPPGRACFTGHPVLTIGYTPTYRPRRISWRQFEVRSCCECTLCYVARAAPSRFISNLPRFRRRRRLSRAASLSTPLSLQALPFFPPFLLSSISGKASLKLSSGAIWKTVRRARLCFLLVEITSCGGGVCSSVYTHTHSHTRATVFVTVGNVHTVSYRERLAVEVERSA